MAYLDRERELSTNDQYWSNKQLEQDQKNKLVRAKKDHDAKWFLREISYDPHTYAQGKGAYTDPKSDRELPHKRTWLHYACLHGKTLPVKKLLEQNADVHWQDKDGRSPLHFATMSGNVEIVELLLDSGALVMVRDRLGYRPVHIAAEFGYYKVLKFLIEKGAAINAAGPSGFAPIHFCIQRNANPAKGNENVVGYEIDPIVCGACLEYLLSKNCDIYARDKYNRYPQRLALELGLKRTAKRLEQEGSYRRIAGRPRPPIMTAEEYEEEYEREQAAIEKEKSAGSPGKDNFDEIDFDDEGAFRKMLVLQIMDCKELKAADIGVLKAGKSDPYCIVHWNQRLVGKTTVIQNSLEPFWEEEYFRLPMPLDRSSCTLQIEVFDRDGAGDDSFLGRMTLKGTEDFFFKKLEQLQKQKCKKCSTVHTGGEKFCSQCGSRMKVKTRFYFSLKEVEDRGGKNQGLTGMMDPNRFVGGKIGIAFRDVNFPPLQSVQAHKIGDLGCRNIDDFGPADFKNYSKQVFSVAKDIGGLIGGAATEILSSATEALTDKIEDAIGQAGDKVLSMGNSMKKKAGIKVEEKEIELSEEEKEKIEKEQKMEEKRKKLFTAPPTLSGGQSFARGPPPSMNFNAPPSFSSSSPQIVEESFPSVWDISQIHSDMDTYQDQQLYISGSATTHTETQLESESQYTEPESDAETHQYNDENNQWSRHYDDTSSAYYWFNSITGETQWDTDEIANGEGSITNYDTTTLSDRNTESSNDHNAWIELFDENNNPYFYNETTGESRWSLNEEIPLK